MVIIVAFYSNIISVPSRLTLSLHWMPTFNSHCRDEIIEIIRISGCEMLPVGSAVLTSALEFLKKEEIKWSIATPAVYCCF